MQDVIVDLEARVSNSFYAIKAANSCDINTKNKAKHYVKLENLDIDNEKIILIVGPSGSGKSTLANKILHNKYVEQIIDYNVSLIDSFSEKMTYDQRVEYISSAGLGTVINWIKPIKYLSNGEQERAKIALNLASKVDKIIIDEFTSVLDRNIAKITAQRVRKQIQKTDKKVIIVTPHYDIIDWLEPDYIIDMKTQKHNKYIKKKRKN